MTAHSVRWFVTCISGVGVLACTDSVALRRDAPFDDGELEGQHTDTATLQEDAASSRDVGFSSADASGAADQPALPTLRFQARSSFEASEAAARELGISHWVYASGPIGVVLQGRDPDDRIVGQIAMISARTGKASSEVLPVIQWEAHQDAGTIVAHKDGSLEFSGSSELHPLMAAWHEHAQADLSRFLRYGKIAYTDCANIYWTLVEVLLACGGAHAAIWVDPWANGTCATLTARWLNEQLECPQVIPMGEPPVVAGGYGEGTGPAFEPFELPPGVPVVYEPGGGRVGVVSVEDVPGGYCHESGLNCDEWRWTNTGGTSSRG